jgi:restriction endonuclease S subunit
MLITDPATPWIPLEDLGVIEQGPNLARFRHPAGEAFQIVQIRNLDRLEVTGILEVETALASKADPFRIKAGQVLVSLRSTPVKAAAVPTSVAGCLAGSNLAVVAPRAGVDSHYLAGLLSSTFMKHRLDEIMGGTVIPSLSVSFLRKLKLPMPPLDEQQTLAEGFKSLDRYGELALTLIERRTLRLEAQLSKLFGSNDD